MASDELSERDLRLCDSIADQAAGRALRGEPAILFDWGEDLFEFAADIGRREAQAWMELKRQGGNYGSAKQ